VGIDRESAVRKAEELVRDGKIELAIGEYSRLVDDQPGDVGAANALGDLYAKVGNRAAAAAQFVQIGDSHRDSGFVPKAVAFYKKALKADPASDHALSQLAQIAIEQELYADATLYLNRLLQRRREQSNEVGVAECLVRLGGFPSATADARLAAARASATHFAPDQTVRLWVDAADALDRAGRSREAVDALLQAADLEPDDRALRSRVVQACATTGQIDRVRTFLSFDTAGDHPDLLLALAEHAIAEGREDEARRALERVIAVAPDRRTEAEAMLGPLAIETPPAPAGHEIPAGFFAVETAQIVDVDAEAPLDVSAAFGSGSDDGLAVGGEAVVEDGGVASPSDVTTAAATETPADPAPAADAQRLEWSGLLDDAGEADDADEAVYVVPDDEPETIEAAAAVETFETVETVETAELEPPSQRIPEPAAAIEAEPEAATPADVETIAALTAASQNPALQFQASAQLGRLLLRLGRSHDGIEWLERAAHAPMSIREQRLDVMYELADALERAGERTRALDVFADLDFDAASYRDVPERMAALRRPPGEGPAR
jgi:tetratricopeptide (TPR) repeat protein